MDGTASKPIVVSEAPTTPVVAANNMAKAMVANASPPLIPLIHLSKISKALPATPEVCIMTPMKIKSGTAAKMYSERIPLTTRKGII